MSALFYIVVSIGVLVAIALIVLLVLAASNKLAKWREDRAIRIKNEDLNRYNMAAFRGTKPRQL